MLPNKFVVKVGSNDERQREFKRQQDRLKMMAPDNERKPVSADDMINNLLQKSDTFKKVTDDLPHWLIVDSPLCCPYYETVWNVVRCSDKMVDTQKISQLLLTSGLHPDLLGYIWNMANKSIPGQLTKQELFVVLALVALAQSNCTFNSLGVLKLIPNAPVPRLHVPFQPAQYITGPFSQNPPSVSLVSPTSTPIDGIDTNNVQSIMVRNMQLPTSYLGNVDASQGREAQQPRKSLADDDFQDFQSGILPAQPNSSITSEEFTRLNPTEPVSNVPNLLDQTVLSPSSTFQSSFDSMTADLLTSSLTDKAPQPSSVLVDNRKGNLSSLENSFADFQSVTADDFSEFQDFQSAQVETEIAQPSKVALPKLTSFIKVSPESERKLRNLSQQESLSAMPESKISSRNQVSSMPSIAVLQGSSGFVGSRDIGSRLANHSLGIKSDKNRHHQKNYKLKPIVSGSNAGISEEKIPKVLSKPPASFLLKETKIPSSDLDKDFRDHTIPELTRSIEIPIVGTFKETTLPVDMKVPSVVRDKSNGSLCETWIGSDGTPKSEDNVDKYSALRELESEVPTVVNEDFGEFLSADLTSEKAVEAWTNWNKSVNLSEAPVDIVNKSTSNSFDLEHLTGCVAQIDDPVQIDTFKSIDLLGDSFDLSTSKELTSEPNKASSTVTPELNLNDVRGGDYFAAEPIDDFGDFVGSDVKELSLHLPPTEDCPSIRSRESSERRTDSLSSFDLGSGLTSSRSDVLNEQDPQEIATKCLNCCHGLLSDAVLIFEGVSDRAILSEIFSTREAKNYLNYLHIAFRISQRVSLSAACTSSIQDDINTLWEKLENLATAHSIPINELREHEESGLACVVCKGSTSDEDILQNGFAYHVSCANLWINCIETSLPCFS